MGTQSVLVAVVDDEQAIRKALQRLFSASDFDAETFASGQEFLDSLTTKHPDCVVLDLQMPGLTGLDILRRLALSSVPIPTIIIAAHDAPESGTQCLPGGRRGVSPEAARRSSASRRNRKSAGRDAGPGRTKDAASERQLLTWPESEKGQNLISQPWDGAAKR